MAIVQHYPHGCQSLPRMHIGCVDIVNLGLHAMFDLHRFTSGSQNASTLLGPIIADFQYVDTVASKLSTQRSGALAS